MGDPFPKTPIGRVGRIVAAKGPNERGFYVEVCDDADRTGGLFVFTWSGDEYYDSWIESADDLDRYFAMRGYSVEWLTADEAEHARPGPRP